MNESVKDFLENHRKDWILIAATVFTTILLIVGLGFISSPAVSNTSITASVYVPSGFLESRKRAADAADNITNLINISAGNLELISGADQRGDYTTGLSLVAAEIDRSVEVRSTAVDLSEELSDMAKGLRDVRPSEASAIGFSAVTTGIELVQRLVSYNNNLQELLNTLQSRLENEGDEQTRARITELINALNEEARVINNLNSEYKDLMVQFDGLTQ
jgi:predicted PurR-regulated permease PerM